MVILHLVRASNSYSKSSSSFGSLKIRKLSGPAASEPTPVHGDAHQSFNVGGCPSIIAPQAQLFETAKDRVGPEALFKQLIKFKQIDPLWTLLGENKDGPYRYCCKFEIT